MGFLDIISGDIYDRLFRNDKTMTKKEYIKGMERISKKERARGLAIKNKYWKER